VLKLRRGTFLALLATRSVKKVVPRREHGPWMVIFDEKMDKV
jgi:hypothetical protein